MSDSVFDGPQSAAATLPTDIDRAVPMFDQVATTVALWASKAWFFVACVAVVVIWAPTFLFLNIDTWQLIINTLTTIITFLLVALLQNTQTRNDDALQHKLNAIADGLADLMRELCADKPALEQDRRELLRAVGLEDHESTD